MDNDIKKFLEEHGMSDYGDYYNYHMALGFYYAYSADAFRIAEMIDNGEVFDEYEASAIIRYLCVAHKVLKYFQSTLQLKLDPFNTAETVKFEDSTLEKGQLTGNKEKAIETARSWVKRFLKRSEQEFYETSGRTTNKSVFRDIFLYEVAVFILYLEEEEINYGFLDFRANRRKEESL